MPLNESKGNMYDFVTHTWNVIKGACFHDCAYCYMKRYGNQQPVRFDTKETYTDLGTGNFIFVGSSCDAFNRRIPQEWIQAMLEKTRKHDNAYLFQSKNPEGILRVKGDLPKRSVICTTIESNRSYTHIMQRSPEPQARADAMARLQNFRRFVTIEPILDFDMAAMVGLIRQCQPEQVNIGADSGGHKMPEPGKDKVFELICRIRDFTKVNIKPNLKRLTQ